MCLSNKAVAALVDRLLRNSYGIMSIRPGPDGERRTRGAGIYPLAALVNHDCMPNMAR
jgi:hypothetical protein